METGYHFDFANPIPEDPEYQLTFPDWIASEIPTRITSISPRVAVEESSGFTLTVHGHDFISSSIVQFGERMLPTQFLSDTELRATVPADSVKRVGTYPVRIVHRSPGWGKTNKINFFVKFK